MDEEEDGTEDDDDEEESTPAPVSKPAPTGRRKPAVEPLKIPSTFLTMFESYTFYFRYVITLHSCDDRNHSGVSSSGS